MNEELSFKQILFKSTKLAFKITWHVSKFIVRNTPKAIVTVAHAKREITNAVVEAYQETQKYHREEALNEKIRALKKTKR